jgi:GNAT superfamily N-acetyltransferase
VSGSRSVGGEIPETEGEIVRAGDTVCWELLDPEDPALAEARRLYETTLEPAERIPWEWVARAVAARRHWRPGEWSPHLLLAARRTGRGDARPLGFAYGAHVPGFGGYACYLGVDAQHRGRGAGTRLLRLLLKLFEVDAACEGTPLPFVLWESHRPGPDAPAQAWELWRARVRLFERVGARWISGLTFLAPDFEHRARAPVPLQLFLIPVETPAEAFDAAALRKVAVDLYRRVYRRDAGDPLFDRTLSDSRPALRPAAEALGPTGTPTEPV